MKYPCRKCKWIYPSVITASRNGHLQCLHAAMKKYATDIRFISTALYWATYRDDVQCVTYLLPLCGVNIEDSLLCCTGFGPSHDINEENAALKDCVSHRLHTKYIKPQCLRYFFKRGLIQQYEHWHSQCVSFENNLQKQCQQMPVISDVQQLISDYLGWNFD